MSADLKEKISEPAETYPEEARLALAEGKSKLARQLIADQIEAERQAAIDARLQRMADQEKDKAAEAERIAELERRDQVTRRRLE